MWFIFLPLKQLSCFGNNNNNISSSSIPNTLWCLFWLWVDKKSVHAKIKCSFFALSLYIYCAFKIHPQHMNNMCFRKLKIKHIVFICSSSSTTHMLLLLHFVEYTFQLCECCIQKNEPGIFASYQQSLIWLLLTFFRMRFTRESEWN